MKRSLDLNLEDFKASDEKVLVTLKNTDQDLFTIIKCFRNSESIVILEAHKINLLKINKTTFLNLPNLTTVDLRENKLQKISKHFTYLKNLSRLLLDDNHITYIPSYIDQLDKLEELSITKNKLTYIPSSIQNLNKLKCLKISNNQITTLPIEIGLLKSLEVFHFDANYFTYIPTTCCYLKHLNEISFDWLEFLEPPFQKLIKENIGKTIITLIRSSLQELIRDNCLFCDFSTFVEKNSNISSKQDSFIDQKKNNNGEFVNLNKELEKADFNIGSSNKKKNIKIFHAIENNYYGIIKVIKTYLKFIILHTFYNIKFNFN